MSEVDIEELAMVVRSRMVENGVTTNAAEVNRLIAAAREEAVREAVNGLTLGALCELCDGMADQWLGHGWSEAEARAALLTALGVKP